MINTKKIKTKTNVIVYDSLTLIDSGDIIKNPLGMIFKLFKINHTTNAYPTGSFHIEETLRLFFNMKTNSFMDKTFTSKCIPWNGFIVFHHEVTI